MVRLCYHCFHDIDNPDEGDLDWGEDEEIITFMGYEFHRHCACEIEGWNGTTIVPWFTNCFVCNVELNMVDPESIKTVLYGICSAECASIFYGW